MISAGFIHQIILSILVGALLGLEREYTKKQKRVGLRTFALISLLGTMSIILSKEIHDYSYLISLVGMIFTCLFSIGLYYQGAMKGKAGFTTNISIILAYLLGLMVGFELMTEAVFLSIAIAIILFSRERLHNLVEHLTEKEVGDLLEFLVLLGMIYPIIPEQATVYGIQIPLMSIWLMIFLVSIINFIAFISSRFITAKREVETLSFTGGLISGWGTMTALIEITGKKTRELLTGGLLIVNSSELLKIVVLLTISAPFAGSYMMPAMLIVTPLMAFFGIRRIEKRRERTKIRIESPFNVMSGVKLALIVLVMTVVFELAAGVMRPLIYPFAFISSFVSSTATIITMASLLAQGTITDQTMIISSVIIAVAGLISNIALCVFYKKRYAVKNALNEHITALSLIVLIFIITYFMMH